MDTLPRPPKRKRSRRRLALRPIDRRTQAGRRIGELRQVFTAALVDAGVELTPMRRLKVEQASAALATAELARARYMRDGETGGKVLDELLRAERRADAAVKRLGLPYERPVPAPPASAAATPARPDLTQLSNSQLERLYALLAEAKENGADGDRKAAEAILARAAVEKGRTMIEIAASEAPGGRIAQAFYTPESWRQLEAAVAEAGLPKDTLCASYESFVAKWKRLALEFERHGVAVDKLPIDVSHMVAWCARWGLSLDAKGRSKYGVALATTGGDSAALDRSGFVDRTRAEH
jgi:hypothetical protein